MESLATALGGVWDGIKWLLMALVGMVVWLYRQDRRETKESIREHSEQLRVLEETRPRRSELSEAVAGLREEVRTDIADLKGDVNARLDIMIKLLREK